MNTSKTHEGRLKKEDEKSVNSFPKSSINHAGCSSEVSSKKYMTSGQFRMEDGSIRDGSGSGALENYFSGLFPVNAVPETEKDLGSQQGLGAIHQGSTLEGITVTMVFSTRGFRQQVDCLSMAEKMLFEGGGRVPWGFANEFLQTRNLLLSHVQPVMFSAKVEDFRYVPLLADSVNHRGSNVRIEAGGNDSNKSVGSDYMVLGSRSGQVFSVAEGCDLLLHVREKEV
ncbi:hypothetical protein NE237_016266 [Protea cynaroides]|uniref:Uncharacterized protein n=1 Tax=Protea cynaroides TaxID=273540 RepID=A0A9Q0QRQ3_9MAGN|nr:hypothetical protein NE237_016266 [Protea cynaroides]